MRVAEVGLWELGRDRQIPLAQSAKIEFTEWGNRAGTLNIHPNFSSTSQNYPAAGMRDKKA
jgi:hypothetical protein